MKWIDLRSDTVTVPTPQMREAMFRAEVGDDVYGEDPTVRALEEKGAAMVGKEAALFLTSGTQANHVAVLTHTSRGDEVICEKDAHIYFAEVGNLALLSGVQARPLPGRLGILDPVDVEGAIRPPDVHFPTTSLLCLENTHNRAGGTVMTVEQTRELCGVARKHGVKVHLDGARIFNAAISLGVSAAALAGDVDSVSFCLSKGLAAPMGSLLCGGRDFINRARRYRKALGGGLRQAGVVAAAGIVALDGIDRLAEDHAKARRLGEVMADFPGIEVDLNSVQTNMVFFRLAGPNRDARAFVSILRERGVKANAVGPDRIRFVTHKDVSFEDIDRVLDLMRELVA